MATMEVGTILESGHCHTERNSVERRNLPVCEYLPQLCQQPIGQRRGCKIHKDLPGKAIMNREELPSKKHMDRMHSEGPANPPWVSPHVTCYRRGNH